MVSLNITHAVDFRYYSIAMVTNKGYVRQLGGHPGGQLGMQKVRVSRAGTGSKAGKTAGRV